MTIKRKRLLAWAVSIAIVVLVIVVFTIVRFNVKKSIEHGLSEIVEEKINALLIEAADPESNSNARLMGLKEVNYEITNINKKDGYYVLTIEIDCICEDADAHEVSQSLLAFDVEDCFGIYDDFHIGKYRCRYIYGAGGDYAYDPLVYTHINGVLVHAPRKPDTDKIANTVKCNVCGKRYKEGSANAKSIKLSNMCENCHANFKWSQDVMDEIGNMPVK